MCSVENRIATFWKRWLGDSRLLWSILVVLNILDVKAQRVFNTPQCPFPIKGRVHFQLSLAMLFLIFIYYLTQGVASDASPIPSISNRSLESNHCVDLTHCRTISNIVWSCLVTIFSCTWVAIHPNIPCPKKREAKNRFYRWIWNPLLSFASHRLPLFVCALLVPEYVLAWAIRQYLSAWRIANENKG